MRDDQIDFTDIVTTKKMCGKPEMKAEDAFLTSLRSAKRWHVDGDKLIIEGDAARLMLKPGVAELKAGKEAGQAPARDNRNHRVPSASVSQPAASAPRPTVCSPLRVPSCRRSGWRDLLARAGPAGGRRSASGEGLELRRRGVLLPPYDTAATLARLAALIARYTPRVVVALGDSFHDGRGPARLADTDRATLRGLQRGRDWIWITGNHDPDPAEGIGGRFL